MCCPWLSGFDSLGERNRSGNTGLVLFWSCVILSDPSSFMLPLILAPHIFPCWLPYRPASRGGCLVKILPTWQREEIYPSLPSTRGLMIWILGCRVSKPSSWNTKKFPWCVLWMCCQQKLFRIAQVVISLSSPQGEILSQICMNIKSPLMWLHLGI